MRNRLEHCCMCNNRFTTLEGHISSYCKDCCLSSTIPYNKFLDFLLLYDFNTAMDNIKSYSRVLRKYFRKTEEEVYRDFINKLNPRRCIMSTKQPITLKPVETWQQMIRDKENLEKQLAEVSAKINKHADDLLKMINDELKEFAVATNSLYTENNTNRLRYSINFNYAENIIEPYPTSYSYNCFVEFTDKDSCRKAIEKFHDDLKEYFDIKVYFRRR